MALPGRTRTRRRSTIVLIVALLMIVGVVAAAAATPAPKVAKVTGTYEYITITESWRAASISAHATDPLKGTWTWTAEGTTYSGPITCLRVSGDDAWLAGPFGDGTGAVFMWVHDGGTPGRNGDTAFTWGADAWEDLADMEELCESMTTLPYGYDAFDVVSGNLNVWDAP